MQAAHATSLEHQITNLEAALHRKTVDMAVAGHDLRQPLQVILGAIERIAPACHGEPEIFWLGAARDAGQRLTEGLTDLAISSQSRTAIVELRNLSLAAIFDRLEADWAPSAWEKGLKLRVVRSDELAHSNAAMLLTILSNLVGNAIKHTTAGGVVLGCRKLGRQVAIDVVDSGPGIEPGLKDRMFDAFTKGTASRDGLGLGLWLVSQSCRTLGHRVEVRARLGRGSRFRLILPAASLMDAD